ncbi:ROK family protein [Dermabacter hominis]|uniref:ROK family protein n=1 Tax=Dermabacter hominis TaxID=36740 RepID=UPI0021A3D2F4|nr:ROK family protein [Dermabacter hominis]MCT2055162.1 ROK family protein [Dermabacter hominis]MCT2083734.1 ROK family protein [Dermabacter hominis]MCT2090820.1 ROK family protein [Dermabacter hominis]MCT2189463.1 ROK family protein [Dermabacter hominis]MCT2226148.1 ROK family protein [Dermabacter hominis]
MTAGPTRVLAVDLGGTKINAAVVVFEEGAAAPSLCQVATTATPARDGAKAVLAASLAVAREALSLAGANEETLKAIGIASAGVIDTARGLVTAATDALPGWPGTNLASVFRAEFGAHTRVLNDVHAHGLGEAVFGAGEGFDSLLLVAIGTGIGGAFVSHGEVLTGARGAAGHIGHVGTSGVPGVERLVCSCGRRGHLEGFASGPGIAAELSRRGTPAASTREVAELANRGSKPALDTLIDAGRLTGRAIGDQLNIVDPHIVAITGGVASASGDAGDAWWAALREGVRDSAMDAVRNTPIVPASAGNHAALLGAAHFALTDTATEG